VARFDHCPSLALRSPIGEALHLYMAGGLRRRLLGLSWLAAPPGGRGILIPRCRSVHTGGMRFSIDIAFVTWPARYRRVVVLSTHGQVGRRRIVHAGLPLLHRRSVAAIEVPAGTLAPLSIVAGDCLEVA
jgi:hypothetical protein